MAVAKDGGLLHDLGVGRGDRVGVISTNSVQYVQAMFAAAMVGAVCVPMNYRAKQNEIAHLLADSGAKVLLVGSRYAEMTRAAAPAAVRHVVVLDTGGARRSREPHAAAGEVLAIVEGGGDDLPLLPFPNVPHPPPQRPN